MGIDPDADEDADRRAAVIKSVTSGVQELVDAGLGKDTKAGTTAYTNMLEALSTGDVSEAQSEIDALVKAGKSDTNIRSQLTEQYKQAYINGTDADREEIIELLTGLQNSQGKAYYTVQDIRKWGK
jgi:DNA polymerase III delta subunit